MVPARRRGCSVKRDTSDYDHQGRVTSTRAFGGEVVSTSYGWIGHLHTGGMGTYGGWQQTTTYASGFERVEQSDVFGHAVYTHDHMPGVTVYYTGVGYDRGGRMVSRSGNEGETVTYRWHNTGLLAYQGSDLGSGYERAASHYDYDAAGRKVAESYARDGVVYTQSAAAYDAAGRMTYWHQNDTALPWATMTWAYDAVGNIRRTTAEKAGLDQWGNAAYRSSEDRWFRYDAMNRVTLDGGQLSGGQIVRGWSGASLAYDAAGQRVSSTRDASLYGQVWVYEPYQGGGYHNEYYYDDYDRGQWVYRDAYYQGERQESFGYAADGQLASVSIAETGYYDDGNGNAVSTGTLDRWGGRAEFHFDGMGRQTRQLDYNAAGQVAYDHQQFYSAAGRVERDHSVRLEAGATLTADTYNDYGWNGAVAGGQVVSATTYSYRNGQHQGTTSFSNGYNWRSGGAQIAWTSTSGQTSSYTGYNYGAGGRLESISISDGRPRTVYITSDLSGQALTRDEYDNNGNLGDPHERWYRFNGNELGHVGNDGTWMSDYAGSIQTRGWVQQNGPFGNNRRYGQDFAKSVDRITSYDQGSGGGGYTVRTGDTLAGIAAQVWGDASLWYKLASANGLSANSALVPGSTLTLPAGVIRSTYNADQLRPYDPADAIGDVSPVSTQPTAKKKSNKCGAFGKILLVAVAVAVTIATSGAAVAALTPGIGSIGAGIGTVLGLSGAATVGAGTLIAASVAGGIVGSVVSQGVGLATGIQDKFSWKGVALAGLSGAIGGGIGASGIGGAGVPGAILRGALGSAATQGVAIATGLQTKFDFAAVAVAGVVGGVGQAIGGNSTSFWRQTAAGAASALAGAAARSLVTGTSFGDNVLAVLPDVIGTTVGRLAARGIAGNGMSAGEKALVTEAKKSVGQAKVGLAAQTAAAQSAPPNAASETEFTEFDMPEIVVTASRQDAVYWQGSDNPYFLFAQYPGRGHNGPPQRVPRLPAGPPETRTERSILGALNDVLNPFTGPARENDFLNLQDRLAVLKGELLQLDPFYSSISPPSGQETWQSARSLERVIAEIKLGSVRAEAIASKTMIERGYVQLPSKLGGDRGFDGVFVRTGTTGRTEGVITESKYRSSGRFSLDRTSMGGQMSETWVLGNIAKMAASSDPAIRQTGRTLDRLCKAGQVTRVGNLLTPSG